jgi:hypothetical protein
MKKASSPSAKASLVVGKSVVGRRSLVVGKNPVSGAAGVLVRRGEP